MQLHQIIAILGILATYTQVLAKGINCKGSLRCKFRPPPEWIDPTFSNENYELHASILANYIDSLNYTTWIRNKEPIACVRSICAFVKNTEGMYAGEVKALAKEITKHGCKRCGSCPVGYPKSNDGRKGELTFNYRDWGCRNGNNGVCPYFLWEERLQGTAGNTTFVG